MSKAPQRINKTSTQDGVQEYLERAQQVAQDDAPQYVQELRSHARDRFAALGFPTPRHEEWKYTDTSPIAHLPQINDWDTASTCSASGAHLNGSAPDLAAHNYGSATRLVFVNGRYQAQLSKQNNIGSGVIVGALSEHWGDPNVQEHLAQYAHKTNDDAFTALNTAHLQDGAIVFVPRGVQGATVEIVNWTTGSGGTVSQPRALYVAEEGAQITIVETHGGSGVYFSNAVSEAWIGPNAQVDHYMVQAHSEQAMHIGTLQVEALRDANFRSHSLNLSGRMIRNNANAIMDGENIEVTLNGLVLGSGEQHIDNHTAMDHASPHCTSHERFAHILKDKSVAVFNGKIFVRIDAQKTDAVQSNRSLLLSPDAIINTKPQLEIFADDVKCTHGATIGQLDEGALFYLRARGISESEARGMLTYAFAEEVLEGVRVTALKERLEQEVLTLL